MCGITGWLDNRIDLEIARRMRDMLAHRGPEDATEYFNPEQEIWLGHRRLVVIDPSSSGDQPMISNSGRYVIVYNGEVYNYIELQKELSKARYKFVGHSDTEVVLAAIDIWGIEKAVEKFNGMFAFAVFDKFNSILWLVRDRIGKKPLYYTIYNNKLAFASELHALKLLPWFKNDIEMTALAAYLRYLTIPGPATIIQNVHKLLPGHILRWDNLKKTFRVNSYWSVAQAIENGKKNCVNKNLAYYSEKLEKLLVESIKIRLRSDVPVGTFLSGGIDSSCITALAQQHSFNPIKTFTLGFKDKSHNEAESAKKISAYLGTEHRELCLNENEILSTIQDVTCFYDEPFADNSNIPTYILSKFARSEVTVVLSGDGGDELFGGYPRYYWAKRITNIQKLLGKQLSQLFGKFLTNIPNFRRRTFVRANRFGGYLSIDPGEYYSKMISAWKDPKQIINAEALDITGFNYLDWPEQMMAIDQVNYLVDDILMKMDRATMAVSLEARAPLLDHRILEFSWQVPAKYKLRSKNGIGKILLQRILDKYIPRKLFVKQKMGFGLPLDIWLRNSLRDWSESLLRSNQIKQHNLFNMEHVEKVWQKHLLGENRLAEIWAILMFQVWYNKWKFN